MENGKLYLVPTPIGNLKDITLRALETLRNVDIIAAEDTRQTLKLLNHFEIKKPLISYHKFNEQIKSDKIIDLLMEGNNVALVSDAGTPGISDPGSVIVGRCIEKKINFEVLPGATAITTALVYSGLDTTKFLFRGFLPRENKERKIVTNDLLQSQETIIFYEAPHRLIDTLEFLLDTFGDRKIAVCRELTKIYQEIYRGTLKEAAQYFLENKPRGEFVLVLEGKRLEEIKEEQREEWIHLSIEEHIVKYINGGASKKEAIKLVAKERELPKSEVYKFSTNI
ncbi:16S rRNA (cytidine(1402)-2'-O)-methyltransferase [Clostridium beijerinckii]|jgi:Predicted methyltransferases|uniref:Ribosomal RNA small subunit methyltransferase I n=2 Tax=Clostridium beijerinckii TaxID=1520 RepID=A0AAE2UXC5_CLOBE|nr:16S rRNA (cytidine(1402)-2'-O)-methyltransferase [Clostridium beijerinckii]ABR36992.1 Uroporphyrin-III C/tetrapyrrole (Corrin/Porphyrin) methyltransferase [Clostridium beijerinckii NCIMB 8052]AIU04004.1 uroporphyrin-III C/tetrapyrrole methyltransferase [Clostridium beijerinckii ATCC 35702]MBF7808360.1 16S rRNA (cytidine(1402)-2'-O)-methyltransferase [Clostridium beijerinckii]NRT21929.1 16S rRNA (cytidine1402-2'-O)-methyltransferase [Clostridium beijerinckii]NRT65565.1 16S rRNA (cytidine1402